MICCHLVLIARSASLHQGASGITVLQERGCVGRERERVSAGGWWVAINKPWQQDYTIVKKLVFFISRACNRSAQLSSTHEHPVLTLRTAQTHQRKPTRSVLVVGIKCMHEKAHDLQQKHNKICINYNAEMKTHQSTVKSLQKKRS